MVIEALYVNYAIRERHAIQKIIRKSVEKFQYTQTIHERPIAVNNRTTIGHWEADTVAGKTGKACLVTLTDRKTRYLIAEKIEKKISVHVRDSVIKLLASLPKSKRKSITPDRGKEFSKQSVRKIRQNSVLLRRSSRTMATWNK